MVYKERVDTTFTKPYLDFIDRLVQRGIYLSRGAAIRAAVRILAERSGLPLPIVEEAEG